MCSELTGTSRDSLLTNHVTPVSLVIQHLFPIVESRCSTSKINVVDCLVQCAYQETELPRQGFTDAWEQVCPDALPAATSDSYGYQQGACWAQVRHLIH